MLDRLVDALRVGESRTLVMLVYPQTVDASANGECLIYAPWNLPGCPTVRVPLHRIIAVSHAR